MSALPSAAPVRTGPRGRWAGLSGRAGEWWAARSDVSRVLLVYALARLFTAVVVDRLARFQAPSAMSGDDPGYLAMTALWDGEWYRRIALDGYPEQIPRDASGAVTQNRWAFYPVFPLLTRGLMRVTGAGFELAGSTLSLVAGAAAVVVLFSLVARVADRRLAFGAVLLLSVAPAAPVLQFAYTESLALLLLVVALRLLVAHRYLTAVPVVLLLGLTRPVALPLALVVAAHLLRRWKDRDEQPLPAADALRAAVLAASCGVAGLLWPTMVWLSTGDRSGYTDTMGAWRAGGEVVPLLPWWDASRWLLGDVVGPVLMAAALAGAVGVVLRGPGRHVGPDLQAWCLAYLLYLVGVLDPYTSTFRYLLLLFPVGAMLIALSRSRAYLASCVVASLALQVVWLVWLWRFVPPSDWPP